MAAAAGLERLLRRHCHLRRHGRRDAAHVEGIDTIKDLVPIEICMGGEVHRGVLPVIDAGVRTLRGADLEEVGAQTVALTHDARDVDADAREAPERAVADAVLRHDGDEGGMVSLVCQRERDIGLRTAVVHLELMGLLEAPMVGRRQPHHDFSEGQDLCFRTHGHSSPAGRCSCIVCGAALNLTC